MMKILLIDNYDSFVYNIVGLLQRCRSEYPELKWDVIKNDEVSLSDADSYNALILSPGPGLPSESGKLLEAIRYCADTHPIFGVCLGCQAIAEVFGGRLRQFNKPRHGHRSILRDVDAADPIVGFCSDGNGIVGRYHSWGIDESSLNKDSPIMISSRDEEGNIMSVRHKSLPIFGVQFHPESVITNCGEHMLKNFIALSMSIISNDI